MDEKAGPAWKQRQPIAGEHASAGENKNHGEAARIRERVGLSHTVQMLQRGIPPFHPRSLGNREFRRFLARAGFSGTRENYEVKY